MKRIRDTIMAMVRDIGTWSGEANVALMAAGIAFFSTLSLAPLLVFAISVAGVFVAEAIVEDQLLTAVAENLGQETADFLAELITAAFRLDGSGPLLALIGLFTTIFFASNMFYWLKVALNDIWGVKTDNASRSGLLVLLWDRLLAALMVLLTSAVFTLTMLNSVVMVDLPIWFIERLPGLAEAIRLSWQSTAVEMVMVTGLMMVAYKLLPDVPLTWGQVLPGAILVNVLVMIGNQVLEIYFSMSILSTAYGAAGSPVILLLWVYYLSFVFFLGALFTRAYLKHVLCGPR